MGRSNSYKKENTQGAKKKVLDEIVIEKGISKQQRKLLEVLKRLTYV